MKATSGNTPYKFKHYPDFLEIEKKIRDPITGNDQYVRINKTAYEDFANLRLNIEINYIRSEIENGVWKYLEFGVNSISSEKELGMKRTGYLEDSGTASKVEETVHEDTGFNSFRDRLEYSQKQKLDQFLEKIKELEDNKIRVESYHKQHVAIKYHQGRAKAWIVIKVSGKSLFLWLRVNPRSFKDEKNLTVLYDDSSKTHGNRRLDLMSSKIEDVMDLVRQSYEFRKSDDFYEKYSEIVRTLE